MSACSVNRRFLPDELMSVRKKQGCRVRTDTSVSDTYRIPVYLLANITRRRKRLLHSTRTPCRLLFPRVIRSFHSRSPFARSPLQIHIIVNIFINNFLKIRNDCCTYCITSDINGRSSHIKNSINTHDKCNSFHWKTN